MNRSYQKQFKQTQSVFSRLFKKIFLTKKLQASKSSSLKTKIKFYLILIIILIISAFFTFWYFWEIPLLSPLSSLSKFKFLPASLSVKNHKKRIVYGFLPYWNLDDAIIQPELTHLSYFGLQIGADGNIITKNSDGTLHPGYNKLDSDRLIELSRQINDTGNQVEIVLVQFDNDTIVKILNSPEAHNNLITSLDSLLLAYPISGINIDIEYTGEITEKLRKNFVILMEKINQHLEQKYSDVKLSIDMYATAAYEEGLWDVDQIGKNVDYIIVMAYDFHRRSSTQAGPVAPLFAGEAAFDLDIHQNLRSFLSQVPKEKILLGVPFYGYEWQTESRLQKSNTFPETGATATYKRVQKILQKKDELQVQTGWDDAALSPYLSYIEDGEIWMIYYEDPTSISFKLEYVQQLDLAGIAIWALGYEGEHRELWDKIEERI